MPKSSNRKLSYKSILKSIFDTVLIFLLIASLIVTVVTASDVDTRWNEFLPIFLGSIGLLATLYFLEIFRTFVRAVQGDLNVKGGRIINRRPTLSTNLVAHDDAEDNQEHNLSKRSIDKVLDRVSLWYSYSKLSLTCMVYNSFPALLIWDTFKLILWLATLTYWRRGSLDEDWDFKSTPLYLYQLHYVSLSATTTEICIYILGNDDFKDVLSSPKFWINLIILPPFTLFLKWSFFSHLSFFDIHWILGFVIWIKFFISLDGLVNLFSGGIERKSYGICRIGIGIFFMACAFAGSMYLLQGIHPVDEGKNQYSYALSQYSGFFYFAFITFSTVGYGDVIPMTIHAKAMVVCFASCMLIWVPLEVNRIIQIVSGSSVISGHLSSWAPMERFVLLIGDVDPIQLSLFISKVYHSEKKLRVLLLTCKEVEAYEAQIRQAKLLRVSLCIINGEIGLNGDINILEKVKAHQAYSIFVLSTFKDPDTRKIDMKTVTRVISLKKYGSRSENILVQFCSPIGPQISLHSFGNLVSLYRIKTIMIVKNITCPGIITLITNLSLNHYYNLPQKQDSELNVFPRGLYRFYSRGAGKRIWISEIPQRFVGLSFEVLCEQLYKCNGYIMVGIVGTADGQEFYRINPSGEDYIIKEGYKGILIVESSSYIPLDQGVAMDERDSNIILRNNMLSIFLKTGLLNVKNSNLIEIADYCETPTNSEICSPSTSMSFDSELVTKEAVVPKSPRRASITASSITDASCFLFDNPSLPIIAIIGYSEFAAQLLTYFEELASFNIVLFGRQISSRINISYLQRFKGFLAVIDGDPMKHSDVNRAELDKAFYFYVIPSPALVDSVESLSEQDLRTIVTYRHLKSALRKKTCQSRCENNPYANIFSLVELHNSSNATYLDDSRWSAWSVFDDTLDPSMKYINSHEYAMGQLISDEMLYSFSINSISIRDNYTIYKILLDLVSVAGPEKGCRGIEIISISDLGLGSQRKTFGMAFAHILSEKNAILVGIYRMGINPMENCVICSPGSDFILYESDMAYIVPNNNGITFI